MLYERWCQIARSRLDEIALRDLAGGGAWTFAQLAAAAEGGPREAAPITLPQGATADFIFGVLRAWRSHRVVCPIEQGQAPPCMTPELPPGIVHVKTTSATTGTPRLVAFTAAQLMA